jgi:fructose-1-phosphate kinase PfkB-like protein
MNLDVLVVNANPLLNLVHRGAYQPGAVNRVAVLEMTAEGKGVNVARVLARHGHAVALTGFAGGHSGRWLRELIRAEGIHDEFVATAAPLRVGFMATAEDQDHPTTVFPNGFPVTPDEYRRLLERIETLCSRARLVIASGSVPDPQTDGLYAELLTACQRRAVTCWVDAYGTAMEHALAGAVAPALAKPNRQEHQPHFRWERVAELHITDGAACIEIQEHGVPRCRVRPPPIAQVNPIGSGDCYLAGLAHGWLQQWELPRRLRYAAAAGSVNAGRTEVALVSAADVERLLEAAAIEWLQA